MLPLAQEQQAPPDFPPPGLKLMPIPNNGFPALEGLDQTTIFESVHPGTVMAWNAATGEKVLILIANDKPTPNAALHAIAITTFMKTLFATATNTLYTSPPTQADRIMDN